ncbi:MAG: hypothetical protein OXC62_04260 [Aestuariivita sp.]|nr:hypothetical protein [Aestuariivita sp.]
MKRSANGWVDHYGRPWGTEDEQFKGGNIAGRRLGRTWRKIRADADAHRSGDI